MLSIEQVEGLYGYAMVLTHNRVDAEDLVQETYVRGLGAAGRLREESNTKAWLMTILRNTWFNELRKRRSAPHVIELDDFQGNLLELKSSLRDAEELLVSGEETQAVKVAIDVLPVKFKQVILLREFEQLSYAEIAIVLDCPTGTVMSRLGRGRAQLKKALASSWKVPYSAERRIRATR